MTGGDVASGGRGGNTSSASVFTPVATMPPMSPAKRSSKNVFYVHFRLIRTLVHAVLLGSSLTEGRSRDLFTFYFFRSRLNKNRLSREIRAVRRGNETQFVFCLL